MTTARQHVQKLIRLSLLRDMKRGYSVYVLYVDGDLVYVGQTNDPAQRLKKHKQTRRGYDVVMKVKCIVESQSEAVRVEGELIRILSSKGMDLENKREAAGCSVPGMTNSGEVLEGRTVLIPRSEGLLKPLTSEDAKAQRKRMRKMIEGSARMAEIEK